MEEETKRRLEKILDLIRTKIEVYLAKCESPIEKFFLLNYFETILDSQTAKWFKPTAINENEPFFIYKDYEEFGKFYPSGLRWFEINNQEIRKFIDPLEYELYPQFEVIDERTNKKFRVDFALFYPRTDGYGKIKVAIECDGHDFHEKTKEQAQKDKEKDRILQANGWLIARFTGSEILRKDVYDLLSEIDNLTFSKDKELFKETERKKTNWEWN